MGDTLRLARLKYIWIAPLLLAGAWADLAFLSVADQVFDMLFAALCIGVIRAILLQTKQTPSANLREPVA